MVTQYGQSAQYPSHTTENEQPYGYITTCSSFVGLGKNSQTTTFSVTRLFLMALTRVQKPASPDITVRGAARGSLSNFYSNFETGNNASRQGSIRDLTLKHGEGAGRVELERDFRNGCRCCCRLCSLRSLPSSPHAQSSHTASASVLGGLRLPPVSD